MSPSPFRTRRLAPEEVRAIVRRAVELADREGGGSTMSEAELAARLAELGLPPEAVRDAVIARDSDLPPDGAGDAARYLVERELAGEVPTHRHADVERALSGAMPGPGRVQRSERGLTWEPLDAGDDLRVTVRSARGCTRVRIEQSFRHRWVKPLGTAAVIGCFTLLLAMLVAGWLRSVPLPISLLLLMGLASLATVAGGAWSTRLVQRSVERRSATLSGAMDRLVIATRAAIAAGPRIAVPAAGGDDDDEPEESVAETPRTLARR